MSMKDHQSDQAVPCDRWQGGVVLWRYRRPSWYVYIPGMYMYSKDPCDDVEYLGPLPDIWGPNQDTAFRIV